VTIDIIFAIKFVHMLSVAVMFGTWLGIAAFMVLAHHSHNTSVVALTSQFVVRIELVVMIAAVVLQPASGVPLAYVIGLDPLGEFWLVASIAGYGFVVLCWLAAVVIEFRVRRVTREAALSNVPLPAAYKTLFRVWAMLAVPILSGMVGLFALMIWQPRWD
jgi:uncharacterized membrane protein